MRFMIFIAPGLILALAVSFYLFDGSKNQINKEHFVSEDLVDYTKDLAYPPENIPDNIRLLAEGTQIKSKVYFKALPVASVSFDQNDQKSDRFEMAVPISFSENSSKEYLLIIVRSHQAIPDISFKMKEEFLAPTELILVKKAAEKDLIEKYQAQQPGQDFYFEFIQSVAHDPFADLIRYEQDQDIAASLIFLAISIIYIFLVYRFNSNKSKKNSKLRTAGASLVEYGLLIALISLIAIFALRKTGGSITCPFTVSGTTLQSFSPFTGPWVFKIPAEGRTHWSQIISTDLAPCCNKAPLRQGYCQAATPSEGYFHCTCR